LIFFIKLAVKFFRKLTIRVIWKELKPRKESPFCKNKKRLAANSWFYLLFLFFKKGINMKYIQEATRLQVKAQYADAYKIVKVDGGYAVFFTADEYKTWVNQK